MKENKIIWVIVIILVGLLLYKNIGLFSIMSESYPYSKSFSSNELNLKTKSSLDYGSTTRICSGGSCEYINTTYHLVQDSDECYTTYPTKRWPGEGCGNKGLLSYNIISIGLDFFKYNMWTQGTNARSNSVMPMVDNTILILDNKEFNTDFTSKLSFNYYTINGIIGTPWGGHTIIPTTEFYLSNNERDILLLKLTTTTNGNILITKNPSGVGYILNIDNIQTNLNIPIGSYNLLIRNYNSGSFDAFEGSEASYFYNVEISNISLQNGISQITIYRKINNICTNLTINQNEVLSTDFTTLLLCQQNDVSCTSNSTKQCSDGDVYYYDSCNTKETKFLDCGTKSCSNAACITPNGSSNVSISCFSLENNLCNEKNISVTSGSNCPTTYYSSLISCQDKINKPFNWTNTLILITIVGIIIGVIMWRKK